MSAKCLHTYVFYNEFYNIFSKKCNISTHLKAEATRVLDEDTSSKYRARFEKNSSKDRQKYQNGKSIYLSLKWL